MPTIQTTLPPRLQLDREMLYASQASLYAIEARSGTLVQHYALSGMMFPHIAQEIIYLASARDPEYLVQAVQASDGRLLWSYRVAGSLMQAPVLADGVVYLATTEGNLFALRAGDGRLLWQTSLASDLTVPASLGPMAFAPPLVMQGTVYLAPVVNAPLTPSLYAFRASDGALLWQAPIPEASAFPLAVVDDVLYLSTSRGCLAVRLGDGTVLWQQELGAARQICSSPLVLGGKVYLSGSEGHVAFPSEESEEAHYRLHPFLCALQASDGAVLWQQLLENAPSATQPTEVFLLNERLYVGTDDGVLGAYRAEDGIPLWRYQTQGTLLSSPTGAGGNVYVGVSDGCVYALGAEEGTLLWQTFVSAAATLVQSISVQGTSLHLSS